MRFLQQIYQKYIATNSSLISSAIEHTKQENESSYMKAAEALSYFKPSYFISNINNYQTLKSNLEKFVSNYHTDEAVGKHYIKLVESLVKITASNFELGITSFMRLYPNSGFYYIFKNAKKYGFYNHEEAKSILEMIDTNNKAHNTSVISIPAFCYYNDILIDQDIFDKYIKNQLKDYYSSLYIMNHQIHDIIVENNYEKYGGKFDLNKLISGWKSSLSCIQEEVNHMGYVNIVNKYQYTADLQKMYEQLDYENHTHEEIEMLSNEVSLDFYDYFISHHNYWL
ncbi:MAG: hypothetical protein J0G32_05835 [Alphaproteobacteria bacterium]|nr:hypothetical protein [Alphaproteobacteria bacterium]OJV15771.1 MAG: hypothetical protein BGO27_07640 [Alphaproteobacteria bacterium 33-17]